eukprot:8467184-Pyramimonas_sp.AAC.1
MHGGSTEVSGSVEALFGRRELCTCTGPGQAHPWPQDRCIGLPGQGRRAHAPILGSGRTWPES